jgi:hypothetical protein
MLKKKLLRYLLREHRAEWILRIFGEEVNLRDLKELVEKEGREEDKLFLDRLLYSNNNLNNKRININKVRR